jgi:hypothetical protein
MNARAARSGGIGGIATPRRKPMTAYASYTDRSNARKAAIKKHGLEPAEFRIVRHDSDGRWHIEPIASIAPMAFAATPADQGAAAAKDDDAERAIEPNPAPAPAPEDDEPTPAPAPPAAAACAAAAAETKIRLALAAKSAATFGLGQGKPRANECEDDALRAEAINIFALKRPAARHIDAIRQADQGVLPPAPLLAFKEAEFYRRTLLGKIQEFVAAKDIDALLAFTSKIIPGDSVRRPIRAYGLLAARALRAHH